MQRGDCTVFCSVSNHHGQMLQIFQKVQIVGILHHAIPNIQQVWSSKHLAFLHREWGVVLEARPPSLGCQCRKTRRITRANVPDSLSPHRTTCQINTIWVDGIFFHHFFKNFFKVEAPPVLPIKAIGPAVCRCDHKRPILAGILTRQMDCFYSRPV